MKQIEVTNILVHPFCDNDVMAIDPTHIEKFDRRKHFILFDHIAAVSVMADVTLETEGKTMRRTMIVSLHDDTVFTTVASAKVQLTFHPWNNTLRPRVDLPIKFADIDPSHHYSVVFYAASHSPRFCDCEDILFFRPAKMLPQLYRVEQGWIESEGRPYKNVGSEHTFMKAYFRVFKKPEAGERDPEFLIKLTDMDGQVSVHEAIREETLYDDDGAMLFYMYYCPAVGQTGKVYFDLSVLNWPLGTIAIDTRQPDELGRYNHDELRDMRRHGQPEPCILDLLAKDFGKGVQDEPSPQCSATDSTSQNDEEDEDTRDFEGFEELDDFDDSWEKLDEDLLLEQDYDSEDEEEDSENSEDSEDDDEDTETQSLQGDAHEMLERMVGLDAVKSKLATFESVMRFAQLRRQAGMTYNSMPLHALFLGAPGTGKTTVAKIIGRVLADIGVLSRGHVVVRDRATLTGQFYSSEAEKTLEALEEAQGGILFIDEAYQLNQPADPKDPGHFVLDTLMTALSDENKRDWMLILAGYTKPTKKLLEMNPGLASRIPASNHYNFEDFNAAQLLEIAQRWVDQNNFMLTPHATDALARLLAADYENRDEDFGNARHVINLLQTQILPHMACRVVNETPVVQEQDLRIIHACDIPQPNPIRRRKPTIGFAAC